jgi:alcohol dehydrogenase
LRAAATSDDLDAKEACLIGSTMANMACGNTRLGLTHAMSMRMEGMFTIPHGIVVGTLLPYVMEFNLTASYERYAVQAKNFEEPTIGKSLEASALYALMAVRRLFSALSFPKKYSASQIDRKAIPQMEQMIMGGMYEDYDPSKEYPMNGIVPSANIRKATIKHVVELYEKSFEGWDI